MSYGRLIVRDGNWRYILHLYLQKWWNAIYALKFHHICGQILFFVEYFIKKHKCRCSTKICILIIFIVNFDRLTLSYLFRLICVSSVILSFYVHRYMDGLNQHCYRESYK